MPSTEAQPMIRHGWGDPSRRTGLPPAALAMLQEQLGMTDRSTPPVAVDEVRMRPPALPDAVAKELAGVVGEQHVRTDRDSRLLHSGGKSYPDLLRRRTGDAEAAPDAVVLPASHDEVQRVLDICV